MTSDYIKTKMLDIDLVELKRVCYISYDLIKENFTPDGKTDYSGQSTASTKLFSQYNLLTLLYPITNQLYFEIQKFFRENCDIKEPYMIQSWLNFYRKGEFIDWHRHWRSAAKGWHGFICVSCEPSKTTYRLPPIHGFQVPSNLIDESQWELQDIESKDGLIVLSESAGDMHRTWPWEYDEPRITIAFDIIPTKHLETGTTGSFQMTKNNLINHWLPI